MFYRKLYNIEELKRNKLIIYNDPDFFGNLFFINLIKYSIFSLSNFFIFF